jgi:hypothetical protein
MPSMFRRTAVSPPFTVLPLVLALLGGCELGPDAPPGPKETAPAEQIIVTKPDSPFAPGPGWVELGWQCVAQQPPRCDPTEVCTPAIAGKTCTTSIHYLSCQIAAGDGSDHSGLGLPLYTCL